MDKTIGFIGSGNMGGAIIGGVLQAGLVAPETIIAADLSGEALAGLEERFGIRTTTDNNAVAKEADILFLAVKPHIYPAVIAQIKDAVKEDVVVVVIAAGQTIETIEQQFGRKIKVVRTMPNTPALVGEGMTAICPGAQAREADVRDVCDIFGSIGKWEIVGEALMDAVTGVSGSSPAYTYLYIEALADATVAEGMPRAQAYRFAAQAVLGAAKMVLETGMHPGALKDMVCSPGGTTIDAVCALEDKGFRRATMAGVKACVDKSRAMTK